MINLSFRNFADKKAFHETPWKALIKLTFIGFSEPPVYPLSTDRLILPTPV